MDFRPAHVIGEGCDCEDGMGSPYIVAWRSDDEFMLRELREDEARRLQKMCLAAHADSPARPEQPACECHPETQLGLF